MSAPEISIVIPVFNEEGNLARLFKRLTAVMDATGRAWEVIFVNDGSRDNSSALLAGFHQARPQHVRVVEFNRNYGQHTAILAAFERVRGKMVLTLDADLQNPPEEIPKFIEAFEKGYDAIGGVRVQRKDSGFRRYASRIINHFREWTTDIRMADQGCMMRAYSKSVVEAVNASNERHTFIPALAHIFASRPYEISIGHSEREVGESKYSLLKLIRLNFDLVTGFTLVPLHAFTLIGCLASAMSLFLVGVLLFRRFIYPGASEAEGVFTLFAILFVLISVVITGIGLIGEYVGRIYQVVQQRPRYIIKTVLDTPDER